jgi:methionyl-tRNA formyltransferase
MSASSPRAVFFGTSAFAIPSLHALRAHADVSLVVTQPDRPSGRGQKLQATPVKAAARDLGIATIEPERLRDTASALGAQRADLFVVASYGKIVPQAVLDLPRLGALNVHPSLLPLYRGATPLQSVLRDGGTETGVTIIVMDAGMDTGDVVLQECSPIDEGEAYGHLHDRLAVLGAELLARAVAQAVDGTLARTSQREMGVPEAAIAATLTRPLRGADLTVDWAWPASRIVNLVRSLSPTPLARATLGDSEETVKVVSARVADARERAEAGSPISYRDAALVPCGEGDLVALERVVPPNRAPMSGGAYLRMGATTRSGSVPPR